MDFFHLLKNKFGKSPDPEVVKLFSCSTQLTIIVDIFNIYNLRVLKQEKSLFLSILFFMSN